MMRKRRHKRIPIATVSSSLTEWIMSLNQLRRISRKTNEYTKINHSFKRSILLINFAKASGNNQWSHNYSGLTGCVSGDYNERDHSRKSHWMHFQNKCIFIHSNYQNENEWSEWRGPWLERTSKMRKAKWSAEKQLSTVSGICGASKQT